MLSTALLGSATWADLIGQPTSAVRPNFASGALPELTAFLFVLSSRLMHVLCVFLACCITSLLVSGLILFMSRAGISRGFLSFLSLPRLSVFNQLLGSFLAVFISQWASLATRFIPYSAITLPLKWSAGAILFSSICAGRFYLRRFYVSWLNTPIVAAKQEGG